MTTASDGTKRVFGPDERDGKWWLFAYVNGVQKEWGPYATEAFANGARAGLEKLFAGQDRAAAKSAQPTAAPAGPPKGRQR